MIIATITILLFILLWFLIGKASIANFTKLLGIHAGVLRNAIDLGKVEGRQVAGATVDKGTLVGILTSLAIVVNEFEFWQAWIIFTQNVPILPEFCE
jgi:hypothetical protein